MGKFLDRFEGIVLNNSRRVISSLILLSLLAAALHFVAALWNYTGSPSVESTDEFDMPSFEQPKEAEELESSRNFDAQPSDEGAKSPQWEHPMPVYDDEIDDIVDDVLPLYIAFYEFSASEEDRQSLIEFIANQISFYESELTEDQLDDAVDEFVDYMDDFSDYYSERAGIDGKKLKDIKPVTDSKIKAALANPFAAYFDSVMDNFSKLEQEAARSAMEASEDNVTALQQFIMTGSIIGGIIILVLLLIIFKVENSLRRRADVAEGVVENS